MSRANSRPTGLTRKTCAWVTRAQTPRPPLGNNCSLAMASEQLFPFALVSPSAHALVRKRIIVTQPGRALPGLHKAGAS